MSRRVAAAVAATTGLAAGAAALAYASRPVKLLRASHHPTVDHSEAVERFGELIAVDAMEDIDPLCASRLLDHGYRTERSIVLYHGYTNCPLQLALLGDLLFDAGYNVLIPRVPRQGLMDKMTDEISLLTSEELLDFTAQTIDIASGLGDRLTVFGFSGGGTLASYAAHEWDAVSEAVLVAPLIGLRTVPNPLVRAVYRIVSIAPERYLWWNPLDRGDDPYSPRAYPRFSTRSLSAYLRVCLGLYDTPPARTTDLERIVLIVNDNDYAVDKRYAFGFVEKVLGPRCDDIETIVFPRQMGLRHDWIDPLGYSGDKLDRGYPFLLEALGV